MNDLIVTLKNSSMYTKVYSRLSIDEKINFKFCSIKYNRTKNGFFTSKEYLNTIDYLITAAFVFSRYAKHFGKEYWFDIASRLEQL